MRTMLRTSAGTVLTLAALVPFMAGCSNLSQTQRGQQVRQVGDDIRLGQDRQPGKIEIIGRRAEAVMVVVRAFGGEAHDRAQIVLLLAQELFARPDIDGGLIGGASLDRKSTL